MKRILGISLLILFFASASHATWYIVGDNATLFGGQTWGDATIDSNAMTQSSSNSDIYYITKNNITLSTSDNTNVKFKVYDGENWNPAVDQNLTIPSGSQNISFVYNNREKTLYGCYAFSFVGDETLGGDWNLPNSSNDMVPSSDGSHYTLTRKNLSLTAETNYKWKFVANKDWNHGLSYKNDQTFTVSTTGVYDIEVTYDLKTCQASITAVPVYVVYLGNSIEDNNAGWGANENYKFTMISDNSEWSYTLDNPGKDFVFKIEWKQQGSSENLNYYSANDYVVGNVAEIKDKDGDTYRNNISIVYDSAVKKYFFKVTKDENTWKLRVTVECNHGTGYTYTAYYINSTGWTNVYGYAFKDSKPITISFPGEQCTKTSETIEGNEVWKWEIELGSADGVPDGVIFSDGYDGDAEANDKSNYQTGNQHFIDEGIYAYYAYNGDTYNTSIYKAVIPDGTTDNGNKFEVNDDVTAQTVEFKRSDFTAGKWATVCLPFDIPASDLSNYGEFYKIKSFADNKVTFEGPLSTGVTAYTPYLFKPNSSGKLFGNLTNTTVKATGTTHTHVTTGTGGVNFIGFTQRTIVTPDENTLVYGFANGNYVKVDEGRLKSFRACITVPMASNAKQVLDMDFEEETTGIETVNVNVQPSSIFSHSSFVYDIQGRKITENPSSLISHPSSKKGVYIVNGKKVMIK